MRINITKLLQKRKLTNHLLLLSKETGHDIDKVMYNYSKFISIALTEWFKRTVKTQKIGRMPMKSIYKPLSPKYKKRKVPVNRNKFWVNSGWLINQLHYWKYKDWFVGYPKYIKYNGKKVKAGDLFMFLEKGTKNGVPARPLMKYAIRWINQNLSYLTKKFIKLYFKKVIKI